MIHSYLFSLTISVSICNNHITVCTTHRQRNLTKMPQRVTFLQKSYIQTVPDLTKDCELCWKWLLYEVPSTQEIRKVYYNMLFLHTISLPISEGQSLYFVYLGNWIWSYIKVWAKLLTFHHSKGEGWLLLSSTFLFSALLLPATSGICLLTLWAYPI